MRGQGPYHTLLESYDQTDPKNMFQRRGDALKRVEIKILDFFSENSEMAMVSLLNPFRLLSILQQQ